MRFPRACAGLIFQDCVHRVGLICVCDGTVWKGLVHVCPHSTHIIDWTWCSCDSHHKGIAPSISIRHTLVPPCLSLRTAHTKKKVRVSEQRVRFFPCQLYRKIQYVYHRRIPLAVPITCTCIAARKKGSRFSNWRSNVFALRQRISHLPSSTPLYYAKLISWRRCRLVSRIYTLNSPCERYSLQQKKKKAHVWGTITLLTFLQLLLFGS